MNARAILIHELQGDEPIPVITALLHTAYAPLAARGMRYLATYQDDTTTASRLKSGSSLVAEHEGQIVGVITLRRPQESSPCAWYERREVRTFGQFAVRPDLQRLGLGRRLLGAVEQWAIMEGAEELALDTTAGAAHLIAWYQRLGFRLVQHVSWEDTNYRSVVLSKTLRA